MKFKWQLLEVKNTQIYKLYQLGRTDTYSGGNYSIHNVYTLHQFITLHSIIDFKVKCIKYRVNQPLPGSTGWYFQRLMQSNRIPWLTNSTPEASVLSTCLLVLLMLPCPVRKGVAGWILTCGRSFCRSCTSEPAYEEKAQWCLPADAGPDAGWILHKQKQRPPVSTLREPV